MNERVAIQLDTLTRLADGFRESRGITNNLTTEQMIEFAKEPIGSGENKLNQLLTKTITEVTAADIAGVTEIPIYAFRNCRDLVSVHLDGVTTIADGAFMDCRSIKELNIPESVQSIGTSAFENCRELTTLILPNTPVELGDTMLYKCWKLEELRIPEGYTKIPNNFLYGGAGCLNKSRILKIYVPSTITYVGYSQFGVAYNPDSDQMPPADAGCDTHIYFATQEAANVWFYSTSSKKGTAYRGTLYMFVDGKPLTNVTLASSLTNLYSGMFPADLDSIDVVCEGDIQYMYDDAVASVKSISFLNNTKVPTVRYNKISFNPDILERIEVPASLYDSWITATNWAEWADYIVAV